MSRGMWGLNFRTEKIQKFLWCSGGVWEFGGSSKSNGRTYRYSCLWTLCNNQDFCIDYSQNKPWSSSKSETTYTLQFGKNQLTSSVTDMRLGVCVLRSFLKRTPKILFLTNQFFSRATDECEQCLTPSSFHQDLSIHLWSKEDCFLIRTHTADV